MSVYCVVTVSRKSKEKNLNPRTFTHSIYPQSLHGTQAISKRQTIEIQLLLFFNITWYVYYPQPICKLPSLNNILILASVILVNMFINQAIMESLSYFPSVEENESSKRRPKCTNRHGSLQKGFGNQVQSPNYKIFLQFLSDLY